MGMEIPKQYVRLHGRPILEHTLERLGNHPVIGGVVAALAPEDPWWPAVSITANAPIMRTDGGEERCHSVLNGLRCLIAPAVGARATDWVLVHDAVRPCVRPADIDRLIEETADHPVGGLLGLPVRDTMKHTNDRGEVEKTINRDGLWHALTPQMFRLGPLAEALGKSIEEGVLVTDEAQAMERSGFSPRMVEGHEDNIKVTRPQDLALAEMYLKSQAAEQGSR